MQQGSITVGIDSTSQTNRELLDESARANWDLLRRTELLRLLTVCADDRTELLEAARMVAGVGRGNITRGEARQALRELRDLIHRIDKATDSESEGN